MISTKEISVIVQGAINKKETPKCLQSIRKYLPDAEIILSTWEGSEVSKLDYDILVENKDPGTTLIASSKGKKVYNNLNRQLFSTQNGLKKATKKYALKLRSDLILTNNDFLKYFDEFQARSNEYKLFERKILIPILFTRYKIKLCGSYKRSEIPFHVSDWWFFGLKSDLDKYFAETPLVEEPYFTQYFAQEEHKDKDNPYVKAKHKFAPEQYFALSAFSRKFNDIKMNDASDTSPELMQKFRKCLVNNFIVLEFKQSGIYLNKYTYSKFEKFTGDQYIDLYNAYKYQKDYREFCDNDFIITEKKIENSQINYAKIRIYKHFYKLIDNNTKFPKKLEEILWGIPITVVNYLSVAFLNKFKKAN